MRRSTYRRPEDQEASWAGPLQEARRSGVSRACKFTGDQKIRSLLGRKHTASSIDLLISCKEIQEFSWPRIGS
jgi:hypothetical protein